MLVPAGEKALPGAKPGAAGGRGGLAKSASRTPRLASARVDGNTLVKYHHSFGNLSALQKGGSAQLPGAAGAARTSEAQKTLKNRK